MSRTKRTVLLVVGVIILIPVVWLSGNPVYLRGYSIAMNLMHDTDPSDPDFKIDNFNPAYYGTKGDLGEALKKMFPPGTSRREIDRILVDTNKAMVGHPKDSANSHYIFPKMYGPFPLPDFCGLFAGKWVFFFEFENALLIKPEDEDRLKEITLWPGC